MAQVCCLPRLFEVLKAVYPGKDDAYYQRWSNGIFCSLQAHITMCSCRPSMAVPIVLPASLENFLPPIEDYMQAQEFMQSFDLREAEKMGVLRVLVWLQHCEQQARYGRWARYFVDPVSQTKIHLTQMFVDSGALQITLDTVVMRASFENQALVGDELDKASSTLPQLQRDLVVAQQKLKKRQKGVESAVTPVARKTQEGLAAHLEATIDQTQAEICRLERMIKDHSARLDFLKTKYSNEQAVKVEMNETEAEDPEPQPAEENMEVEVEVGPEQPSESAQEDIPSTEQTRAAQVPQAETPTEVEG